MHFKNMLNIKSTMRFSKYEFNNKLLSNLTLFRVIQGIIQIQLYI